MTAKQNDLGHQGLHPDDRSGMAWWNGLTEADRRYWCFAAMTATPAEAWRYFKNVTQEAEKSKVITSEA